MGFKDNQKNQTKVLLKKKQVRTKKGKQNAFQNIVLMILILLSNLTDTSSVA